MISSAVQTYAIGRIVIWSQRIDPNTEGLHALLNPAIRKIAIANPKHAPYGRRAEEALKYEKVYEKIKTKLVFGENVSQTAQFVTTGAADVGIIALSLALSPTMKKLLGYYYVIPENMHQPLEQGFAMLRHAERNSVALAFSDFMISEQAVEILRRFGFEKKQ
jgi:molybdate transport system substrate-binding protein